MSRMPDEDGITRLLQQGLRNIPTPEPTVDFDRLVRARLRRPEPRWQIFLNLAQPILVPAACALIITLMLLRGMGTVPQTGVPGTAMTGTGGVALDRGPDRMRSIEQGLERLDRETPSLGGFGIMHRADRVEPDTQPQPRRHRGTSGRRVGRVAA